VKSKSTKNIANKAPNTQKSTRARTTDRAYGGVFDRGTLVLAALENPKYKWRTVGGIAKEAGVDGDTARRVITELGGQVVRSSIPSITGEELYTTRRHYRESERFFVRLGAILRNRAG
jgi:ribosomal protein S25